ncbi:chorismate lyase [Baaleninema sp.]|uniref:chorismate lyase n=1 Tax=Baaleninema sp. TaxID=3101197 RepID=UPI003CFCB041
MTATFKHPNRVTEVRPWCALDPLWQGDETAVREGLPHQQLAPAWQILLLGDGSPTRHLKLLTGEPTEVDVIDMSPIGTDTDGAPSLIGEIPTPRLRRQVWLRTASGQRLAYAASWWGTSHIDDYLQNRSLPIWENLSRIHAELYRDVRGLYYGRSSALAEAFEETGPFWGRHYLFWHHGKPLTLIYEVFSPYLRKYLGPMRVSEDDLKGRRSRRSQS